MVLSRAAAPILNGPQGTALLGKQPIGSEAMSPQQKAIAMHLRTIIIPAAGLGTRLLPATKAVPKELLNVYDRPVLQFAIDEAIDVGAERIIVVIHPNKFAIRDYLMPNDGYIHRLGACGEIQLTDALAMDADRVAMTAFRFAGQRFDCGNHDGLLEAGLARQRTVKSQRTFKSQRAVKSQRNGAWAADKAPFASCREGRTPAFEGTAL